MITEDTDTGSIRSDIIKRETRGSHNYDLSLIMTKVNKYDLRVNMNMTSKG